MSDAKIRHNPNVISVLQGPAFDKCEVALRSTVGQPSTVISGSCTPRDQTPDEVYWTNMGQLTAVVMNWEVGHNKLEDAPLVPSYLRRDVQGIVSTEARIYQYDASECSGST